MTLSPTQPLLTPADVARLADEAFGTAVAEAAPLSGGGFASVWRVLLADGRDLVLKVGPPPGVRLLEYEYGMVAAEARYLRLAAGHVPVPSVVHKGDDHLFATRLPGTALPDATGTETAPVRRDLGAALAALHLVTGERYGYDDGPGTPVRPSADNWPDAFEAIIGSLLRDADAWEARLPLPAEAIAALVHRHRPELSEVDRPALVHFDLWDGNVLVVDGRLSGLVDGERYLFGDPLIDFVSPHLHGRMEEEPAHPFRIGYGKTSFTDAERRRVALYRLHLFLLMVVEVPSRAMPEATRVRRFDRLADALARVAGEH